MPVLPTASIQHDIYRGPSLFTGPSKDIQHISQPGPLASGEMASNTSEMDSQEGQTENAATIHVTQMSTSDKFLMELHFMSTHVYFI